MQNLGKNKLSRFLTVLIILLLVIILALFGYFVSPISPFQMCTVMGCRDSLVLDLSREPTTDYTVTITADSGETRQVACTPGKSSGQSSGSPPATARCQPGKVIFFDFAPSSVTVEITWQGGSFSASGSPSYHVFQPNGPSCPPECQAGSIQVTLP